MADFSRLPGPNADLWDWQLVAACRGVDSSLFFHPEGERGAARSAREAAAKEVCMRCPVRAECATHALAVREPYGVWGGLTEDEREAMMGRSRHRSTSTDSERDSRYEPEDGPRHKARHDTDHDPEPEHEHEHDLDHDDEFGPEHEAELGDEHAYGYEPDEDHGYPHEQDHEGAHAP